MRLITFCIKCSSSYELAYNFFPFRWKKNYIFVQYNGHIRVDLTLPYADHINLMMIRNKNKLNKKKIIQSEICLPSFVIWMMKKFIFLVGFVWELEKMCIWNKGESLTRLPYGIFLLILSLLKDFLCNSDSS